MRLKIYHYLSFLFLGSIVILSGCTDDLTSGLGNYSTLDKDNLTLTLNIAGQQATRAISPEGENEYNENKIGTVDLFFYAETTDEQTDALFHSTETAELDEDNATVVKMATSKAEKILNTEGAVKYRIIAIANCPEAKNLEKPTIEQLKQFMTRTDEFRKLNSTKDGPEIPSSFVMTNFLQNTNATDQGNIVTLNMEEGSTGSVEFRRVAAKIRVGLNIAESIEDNGDTWYPDYNDIRIFFNNGVRKARLDGTTGELELVDDDDATLSDYVNISTSGVKETEDYYLSRRLTKAGEDDEDKSPDNTHPYYNDIPFYTYPNHWELNLGEEHQTWITIVIPWVETEVEENGEASTEYTAAYYKVPVTKDTDIVSNGYYYIRASINMMGSNTPDNPMIVDMECEVADWGTSEDTEASLRPIRYLILNQNEFVLNNTESIEIPFNSTHYSMIEMIKVTYYNQTTTREDPKSEYLPGLERNQKEEDRSYPKGTENASSDEDMYTFTCDIDNTGKIIKFTHDFNKSGKYSRYDVEITIRHSDKEKGTVYSSTIFLHYSPAISVTSEALDDIQNPNGTSHGAWVTNDGWILVNGYGYNGDRYTGNLGTITRHTTDNHVITTFTATQLSEADKAEWGWSIDDPRTNYINNLADKVFPTNTTMSISDTQNEFATWTDYGGYGGPYDGTQRSGGSSSNSNRWQNAKYDVRTIWEWYSDDDEDWEIEYTDESGSTATWSVKDDKNRSLRYYYPTSPDKNRDRVIAPKFSIVSGHAYDAGSNDDGIRLAARKCATYQQAGYPAGRWRLPTRGEIQFAKKMQRAGVVDEVFGGNQNWSATGSVDRNGEYSGSSGYTRCVYDNWYWEQVDKNGNSWLKIPQGSTVIPTQSGSGQTKNEFNWCIFTWGDRPRENYLGSSSRSVNKGFTVQDYLEQNAPGNYVVVRKDGKVKLEKMKK